MTQIDCARKNELTPEVEKIAETEGVSPIELMAKVAEGKVAVLKNINHKNIASIGIGEGLSIKVNANIGTSKQRSSIEEEIKKLEIAQKTGAHTVMDLSTGEDIDNTRRIILEKSKVPIGTVPVYQIGIEAIKNQESFLETDKDKIFSVIENHCRDGVDFITVHCGVTRNVVKCLEQEKRITGIVSRGGSMHASWIKKHNKENPLYEYFDELLDIVKSYDTTLSLGDGIRPGCGADAGDRSQVMETIILGELVQRARKAGVQTMVEGPGHVPLNLIAGMIETIKTLTKQAPLYVLGPLVTDIAPGYDHITSAIGGTVAAFSGADFLCYVTPSEHLGLPDLEQVKQGVIKSAIAAHAADVAKGRKKSIEKDRLMSVARMNLDWKKQAEYAIDKNVFENIDNGEPCTMCGEYCSMKIFKESVKI